MKCPRIIKLISIIFLSCLGILLFADLDSIHQIYRIPDAMINRAVDAKTAQGLIADRERRDREERTHKTLVGAALTADVVALLWIAAKR
jgi:hypothetical protein